MADLSESFSPRPFHRGLTWHREGIALLLGVGPLRVVVARPSPFEYGGIWAESALTLYLARACGAAAYLVRHRRAVSRELFHLSSPTVRVIAERSASALLLRAAWQTDRVVEVAAILCRERLAGVGLALERMTAAAAEASARMLRIRRRGRPNARKDLRRRVRDYERLRARRRVEASGRRGVPGAISHGLRERHRRVESDDYFGLDFRRLQALDPFPVGVSERSKQLARRLAAANGVDPDGRLVVLHVRESGFHAAQGREYGTSQWMRNARVESYFSAVDELVGRGYSVIRIGDPSMTPIARQGVLDAAALPELLQVWALFSCEFFIAADSGPLFSNWITQRPAVYVNVTNPLGAYPLLPADRYILKHVIDTRTGSEVSLADLPTATFYHELRRALRHPEESPFTFRDNTDEEIHEAVLDELDVIHSHPRETPEQAAYHEIAIRAKTELATAARGDARAPIFLGAGRIAPTFAARDAALRATSLPT